MRTWLSRTAETEQADDPQQSTSSTQTEQKPKPKTKPKSKSGRESIESFVVVFVAFLVWSLEAEGFVIPTGSMATTLLGRHKEIVCPECGSVYTVNADREVDSSGSGRSNGVRVLRGTCVNCRLEAPVDQEPSFTGDRIYVMKYGLHCPCWATQRPSRLNAGTSPSSSFPKSPRFATSNALVGMPNEVIRIEGGDLWMRPVDSSSVLERLRRPPHHQQAMQMLVYDDEHRAHALQDDPRWLRWKPSPGSGLDRTDTRAIRPTKPDTTDWSELRYHHLVPSPEQWAAIRAEGPLAAEPRATLITDFNSYNTDVLPGDEHSSRRAARPWFQPHWVGDLTLSLRLNVHEARGAVRLELVKAGMSNRCEIDLATGQPHCFTATRRWAGPHRLSWPTPATTRSRSPTLTIG